MEREKKEKISYTDIHVYFENRFFTRAHQSASSLSKGKHEVHVVGTLLSTCNTICATYAQRCLTLRLFTVSGN